MLYIKHYASLTDEIVAVHATTSTGSRAFFNRIWFEQVASGKRKGRLKEFSFKHEDESMLEVIVKEATTTWLLKEYPDVEKFNALMKEALITRQDESTDEQRKYMDSLDNSLTISQVVEEMKKKYPDYVLNLILPNGKVAPDNMTMGALKELYEGYKIENPGVKLL